MKVKVYYNLHKHCFSVQHKGIIIAHRDIVCIKNATFTVREAGRQKVLREGRKNVHAYVVGEWVDACEVVGEAVTYNPYKYSTFVRKLNEIPIYNALLVRLENRHITASGS